MCVWDLPTQLVTVQRHRFLVASVQCSQIWPFASQGVVATCQPSREAPEPALGKRCLCHSRYEPTREAAMAAFAKSWRRE
jgi:hypothetical protein